MNGFDMTPLDGLIDRDFEHPALPDGGQVIAGDLGSTSFIIIGDDTGRVEVSLSTQMGSKAIPASDAQVAAFFRKWGYAPSVEAVDRVTRCRIFIMAAGTTH